ncbi:TlpA family protein disulfide reductase [Gemmatimonadota bacterium]
MIRSLRHTIAISLSALAVVLFAVSCGSSDQEGSVTPAGLDGIEMFGQGDMQWVLDNIAIFRSRTALISSEREAVTYLRDLRKEITILIFMGSWNVSSQIHVPALFATLQQVDNKRITVKIIGMDRRLQDRDRVAERYDVSTLPTFVLEHKGIEVGRIIETPSRSIALDVITILRTSLGR